MFKHIMTLLRGQAQQAEDAFADRNALPILNQQIRDAARGLEAARRALAAAMAQARMEKENTARLSARKLDLEGRALTALQSGREDLATEAATTLAALEDDLANAERAEAEYAQGIDKLSRVVKAGETRLTDLERGERLAVARDRAQRLRAVGRLADEAPALRQPDEDEAGRGVVEGVEDGGLRGIAAHGAVHQMRLRRQRPQRGGGGDGNRNGNQ